jgi:hypothetical protein
MSRSSSITSGGRNRSTFPKVPAVSTMSPALWHVDATAFANAGSRSGELDGQHRATATNVADLLMLLCQRFQTWTHHGLDPPGRAAQVVGDHGVDGRKCCGAGDRVAAVRSAEATDVNGVHDLRAARHGSQRQAARDAFRGRDQVRHHAVVSGREPVAGTAEAGLDPVGDQQTARSSRRARAGATAATRRSWSTTMAQPESHFASRLTIPPATSRSASERISACSMSDVDRAARTAVRPGHRPRTLLCQRIGCRAAPRSAAIRRPRRPSQGPQALTYATDRRQSRHQPLPRRRAVRRTPRAARTASRWSATAFQDVETASGPQVR